MKTSSFREYEHQIIHSLNLKKELEELGLRIIGPPNPQGWASCHAINRVDTNPSAAVNLNGTNGTRGRYRDMGGAGDSLSLWELASRLQPERFPTWEKSREYFAGRAGVKLAKPTAERQADKKPNWESKIRLIDTFNPLLVRQLEKAKPPITAAALESAGCKLTNFPKGRSGQLCVAMFAQRGPKKKCGVALIRANGQPFEAIKDGPGKRKIHVVGGSQDGLFIPGGWQRLKKSATVWLTEGPTDCLSLWSGLPDGHAVACNLFGASTRHRIPLKPLRGKSICVVGDVDEAGDAGARKVATVAAKAGAEEVRLVRLPFEESANHGADLRDWINQGGTFEELLRLAHDAEIVTADPEPQTQADGGGGAQAAAIANFDIIQDGNTKRTVGRPMEIILEDIQKVAKGNIRRVDHSLFYHQLGQPEVTWISKPPALFGLLGMLAGSPPSWKRDSGTHSKEETFAQLQVDVPCFSSVERFPHFPPILDAYYMHQQPSPGDGSALRELVGFFNPATEHDREMILALLVTPFWGGPPGARPAFLIGSDSGRGDGKTTLAQIAALLVGGALEFGANDDPGSIRTRLLSDEGLSRRTVILDNLKSSRLSLPEVESLITSPVVSGKKLYHGEGQRANYLTWMLTSNTPGLCSDLSGRVVPIRLAKPKYSADWEDRLRDFVEASRDRIISDIAGFFESPQAQLSQVSRWGRWERDVLSRLQNPPEIQKLIAERRADSDSEVEEATILEDYVRSELEDLLFRDIDSTRIFIPSQTLVRWFNEASGERRSTIAAARAIKQMISEGKTNNLAECKTRSWGRGFLWLGRESSDGEEINRDLLAHEKYRSDRMRESRSEDG